MPLPITLSQDELNLRQTLLNAAAASIARVKADKKSPYSPLIAALTNELLYKKTYDKNSQPYYHRFDRIGRILTHATQHYTTDPKAKSILDALYDPAFEFFWHQWLNDNHTKTLINYFLEKIHTHVDSDSLFNELNTTWLNLSDLEKRFLRYSLPDADGKCKSTLRECLTKNNLEQLVQAVAPEATTPINPQRIWRERLRASGYRPPFKFLSDREIFSTSSSGQSDNPQHPLSCLHAHQRYHQTQRRYRYHAHCLAALISQQQQLPVFVGRLSSIYDMRRAYQNLTIEDQAVCQAPDIITADTPLNLNSADTRHRVNSALCAQTIASFKLVKDDLYEAARQGSYNAQEMIVKYHLSLCDFFTYEVANHRSTPALMALQIRQAHCALIHALNITREVVSQHPGPGHILRAMTLIRLTNYLANRFSHIDEAGTIWYDTLNRLTVQRITPKTHNPHSLFSYTTPIADWRDPLNEANSPFLYAFLTDSTEHRLDLLYQLRDIGLNLLRHVRDHEVRYTPALQKAGFPTPVIFPADIKTVSELYDHYCERLGVNLSGGHCGTYRLTSFA